MKITMPRPGQSMEEGTILKWHKQEGDAVAKGDVLFEVDTDKAAVEIEAPEAGVLRKILCPAGATVPVATPIAILAAASEDVAAELSSAEAELLAAMGGAQPPESAPSSSAAPAEVPPAVSKHDRAAPAGVAPADKDAAAAGDRPKASPAARKVARERGVDLAGVSPGSGPEGRILSTDVPSVAPQAQVPVAASRYRRPMSGMRRAIARTMLAAKQTIPHFYMKLTVDAGPLCTFYQAEKQKYPCTINDILTLACARVIRDFPAFRSRFENEEVVEFPAASIGVAVGMDEGLVVPVLAGAEGMSLAEVAVETQRIVEAARNGKVVAMGQGVFTISNLGGFGVEEFTAIINPPESAILAVGAIRESVLVKDGGLRPCRIMTLTLSADHRLVDGLMAAKFLARLKGLLEAPEPLREAAAADAAPTE